MLQCFSLLLPALVEFLKTVVDPFLNLKFLCGCRISIFLQDITQKLNDHNLCFQGKDKDLGEMISDVQTPGKVMSNTLLLKDKLENIDN